VNTASRAIGTLSSGLVVAAVIAAALGSSFLIAVQFFRGFEMSDEAFVYSLTLAGGSLDRGWFFGYAYLTAPLFDLVGQQVWAMRVVRFLLYLAVGLALMSAVVAVLRRVRPRDGQLNAWSYFALIGAAFLGSYWAWGYLPPVISYNELASWFALLAIVPILFIESGWLSRYKWMPIMMGAVSGVFLTFLIVSKLPTALGLLAVLVTYIFLLRGPSLRWLYAGVGLGLGVASTCLVSLLAGLPTTELFQQGTRALVTGDGAPGGYQPSTLLRDYMVTAQDAIFVLRGPILLLVLAMLVFYFVVSALRSEVVPSPKVSGAALALATLFLLFSFVWAWGLGLGRGGGGEAFAIGFAMTYFCVTAGLLFVVSLVRLRGEDRMIWLRAGLLLIAAPLLVVAGTNNPFTFQLHLVIAPVLLLATASGVVIWLKTTSALKNLFGFSLAAAIAGVGVSAFTLSALWQGVWANPYRQLPLDEQTFVNPQGILRWVGTDEATRNLAQGLPQIARDLGLTETATTAWDNPGLVLFFNNSQFASTWQLPLVTTSTAELFEACAAAPQTLIVLDDGADDRRQRAGEPSLFYDAVTSCGAKYPSEYSTVANLQPPAGSPAISTPRGPSDPIPAAPVQVQAPKSVASLGE
jgi:hypothetical protein